MDYFYNFRGNKKRSNYVRQMNVEHKGKSFHFRADFELSKDIKDLSGELGHSDSKIIKDILTDFFLERHQKEWEEEIKELK